MVAINVFEDDAFSFTQLVGAIDKVPYNPTFMQSLNLCVPRPVTTTSVYVEERNGTLGLVQTTPRGSPPPERTTEKRAVRPFKTVRIAKKDRLMADEIAGIRAFGSESDVQAMQKELMRRLSGPAGLQSEIEMTWEHMLQGMVQGIVLDADGSVIYNYYDEFGISQPDVIYFDLTGANAASTAVNGATVLKAFIRENVVRPMIRASKGMITTQSKIMALCGNTFFDKLTSHGDVARAYGNYQQVKPDDSSGAFEVFYWGGVYWVDYRGTDDNSTIAIDPDEVKFFPANAPGIFINAWSPGEGFDVVNTPGIPLLPRIVVDPSTLQEWVDAHLRSYPLHICSRPEVLLRGSRLVHP
jgi:hypothetical protein